MWRARRYSVPEPGPGYVALFGDLVSQTFVPSGDFAFSLTLNVDVGCV